MNIQIITEKQITNRQYWIKEISKLSGDFGADASKVEKEISLEIKSGGLDVLLGHLRLCGVIPEGYGYDSSEEKLYSKYTDIVIHEAFNAIGLTSIVLKERADAADVECVTDEYSFVADAKAFRLSRTAKNQKDFKVQAMNNWKKGKPYAMIVSPVYQLPYTKSQIYEQAVATSVCIFTYTHLSVLVKYAKYRNSAQAKALLLEVFKTLDAMNPTKSATQYWLAINRHILDYDSSILNIWREEKIAALESVYLAKKEAMMFLASERERIMKLSRQEAIKEVLRLSRLENKIKAVKSVGNKGLSSIL